MNARETAELAAIVRVLCPAQTLDLAALAAWEMVLFDVTAADARAAVGRLARRECEPGRGRFIDPSDIRSEAVRARRERIERHPHVDPPPALADAPSAVVRDWRRAVIRAIGDGETVTPKTAAELAAAHTRQEINAC